MKFRATKPQEFAEVDAVVVPLFDDKELPKKGLTRATRSVVERMVADHGGSKLYTVTTHFGEKTGRIITVGAGRRAEYVPERARSVASAAIKSLWRSNARRVAFFVEPGRFGADRAAQATVEGVVYAMWRPEAHRTRAEDRRLPRLDAVTLLVDGDVRDAIRRGEAVGEAVNLSRRLANEPANLMTPSHLAGEAKALAKAAGLEVQVLDRKKCESLGMHSYLSVAQGSDQPPAFIVLRHKGRGGSGFDVAFVGKGITFDSGGISIKPAENMHRMKDDMTGAAAVIAAMGAIARLGVKANVIGVAPCTENLPGGHATKPGDVFTSLSGRTVEVVNTDAEGRLVLIDGVTYAQREGARRIVDVATLTGAIGVALGPHFTGLFGRPETFVDEVRRVGNDAGDRLWPMPLTDEYRDEIKSEIADITNSAGREGGASKGAAFIEAGVEKGVEWVHLDIASQAWSDKDRPHSPKGPQGPGVRTLVALAEHYAA
ncbi:MAG TPA: leucyl aminopeptidase [Candidatus Limnocylindria bacterium]|nr:leucyl aminopeptidase [Candidatus Limnocylindria bacterium]